MTPDEREICELISGWFEKKPIAIIAEVCKTKFWTYRFISACAEDEDDSIEVIPLDYYHDEAANAKLLEAMPYANLEHSHDIWGCCPYANGRAAFVCWEKDRKYAVVRAFLKFAALKPDGEAK